ncbi:hypothetical protein [Streptomyces flavidovirens]|uniref:hypothetical protein n=1 Tax=Streptomyces flavidovirens TaxID=67298 RepID=UPI0036971C76
MARASPHCAASATTSSSCARRLFDLAECPPGDPGQVATKGPQANPLLQNAEGMALGEPWTTGKRKGWRPLYLVSDDNLNEVQITRFYLLAVRV